ncbi:hypothetical protein TURU_115285 [Turdus rufiventris]|nr:hypothetical protein TURU_115285 [Turdus rufiventris]
MVICDNMNFKDFMTALDWAVKHGNLEMAEMVAKAGVDVNAKSEERLARGYSGTPYEQKKEGCSRHGCEILTFQNSHFK